jgi:hypothetical protein
MTPHPCSKPALGFGVEGMGFDVCRFRVQSGPGLRVLDLNGRVAGASTEGGESYLSLLRILLRTHLHNFLLRLGLMMVGGFGAQGSVLRAQGSGFRLQGLELRISHRSLRVFFGCSVGVIGTRFGVQG